MWGSDWPVVLAAAPYARWDEVTHELLIGLRAPDRELVLGATCARFYGLTGRFPSTPAPTA
jgi:predicted TIM-barrel fold metal-dependent hydrolase